MPRKRAADLPVWPARRAPRWAQPVGIGAPFCLSSSLPAMRPTLGRMLRDRSRRAAAALALVLVACAGSDEPDAVEPLETAIGSRGVWNRLDLEAAGTPTPTPAPSSQKQRGVRPPVLHFSKPRAMAHVRKLARDIGIRERATPNERAGARYVARKFRSFGYDVKIQKFSVDGGTSRNVVATWSGGTRRYGLVIGGHMDSVPGAPGANDNASGTAVVFELARIYAGTSQARFVKFVGFGSEEYGDDGRHHVGSQVYVKRLGQRRTQPTGRRDLRGHDRGRPSSPRRQLRHRRRRGRANALSQDQKIRHERALRGALRLLRSRTVRTRGDPRRVRVQRAGVQLSLARRTPS